MKKVWLLLLLVLISCSTTVHNQYVYQSEISRYTASEKFSEVSAMARLQMVKKHLESLVESIEKAGNPRFYLLENFLATASSKIQNLEKNYAGLMTEEVFIPRNREVALEFVSLVESYKLMNKVGIYLSYNQLLPVEDEITSQNFLQFDKAMNHYVNAINELNIESVITKIEDAELESKIQVVTLMHYLANRIDRYYEGFVTKKADQRTIQKVLKAIHKISPNKTQSTIAKIEQIQKSSKWKKMQKLLENLDLPDSSSIDGVSESFEKVMSVQVCTSILNDTMNVITNK